MRSTPRIAARSRVFGLVLLAFLVLLLSAVGSAPASAATTNTSQQIVNDNGQHLGNPAGGGGTQLRMHTRNAGAGKCIGPTVPGKGDPLPDGVGTLVNLWDCDGNPVQTVSQHDNHDGSWTYSIVISGKRYCLDSMTGQNRSGTAEVGFYACVGANAQKWVIGPLSQLQSVDSPGKCLDDTSKTANGTRIQLRGCTGNPGPVALSVRQLPRPGAAPHTSAPTRKATARPTASPTPAPTPSSAPLPVPTDPPAPQRPMATQSKPGGAWHSLALILIAVCAFPLLAWYLTSRRSLAQAQPGSKPATVVPGRWWTRRPPGHASGALSAEASADQAKPAAPNAVEPSPRSAVRDVGRWLRLGDGIPFSQRFKKLFTLVKDTDAVEAAEPDHSIPPRGDREQGSASPMVVDARRAELSGSAPPASPAGVHAPEQAKTEESRPLPEPRPQVTPDGSGKDETEASGSPDSGVPVPPGPLPPASEPAAARAAAGAGPRIRLESGPSPQTGFEPEAADRPISGATPDPRPLDDPAAGEPQASPQTVHVQPVPGQAACAVPVEQGIVQERAWLRRSVGDRYDAAAGFVSRVMSESPGLGGGDKATAKDVLVDLSAVRLYLSGETRPFDAAVRGATVGPHVPLARCVAAGLRRLPSYRGAAMLRAALGEAERGWYHQGRVVTEWAFCAALAGADPGLPGNTDILIWSLTARRTALLEPKVPDRVLFLPGTRFKVLHVRTGDRYVVLLRELSLTEMADDGRAGVETLPLDEIALAGLERADTAWQEADRPAALPPEYTDTFDAPPGLITAGRQPVAAKRNGAVPTRKVVRR